MLLANTLNEMVLIRGVGKNFTSNVDLFGRGLYLTDDIEVAKFYGNKIKKYDISGKIFDTNHNFTSNELVTFFKGIDKVFKTNLGSKYLKEIIEWNEGEVPNNISYLEISHSLDSRNEFQKLLQTHGLLTNENNTYANDCTAMNIVLKQMGYIGLKYTTSEIEDLEDIGLGNKNAYVIFDQSAIKEII